MVLRGQQFQREKRITPEQEAYFTAIRRIVNGPGSFSPRGTTFYFTRMRANLRFPALTK